MNWNSNSVNAKILDALLEDNLELFNNLIKSDNVDLNFNYINKSIGLMGYTLLIFTIRFRRLEMLKKLLEFGPEKVDRNKVDLYGNSPLLLSIMMGNDGCDIDYQILKVLLQDPFVNTKYVKNSNGTDAMKCALWVEDIAIIHILLDHNIQVNWDSLDSWRREWYNKIVKDYYSPYPPYGHGYLKELQFPPLYVAIELGLNNIVNKLLENTRTNLNISDKCGRSILMIAIAKRQTYIIDKVIEYVSTLEINSQKKIINKKNDKKDSVLYLLVDFKYNTHYIQRLLDFKDEKNNLLLDINISNMSFNTPLHRAVDTENNEVTKLLIEHGAQLNLLNQRDFAPLHIAVLRNNYNIVQLLIDKGADINFQKFKKIFGIT